MRYSIILLLACITNIGLSQVTTFPNSESFELTFSTGKDIAFITNWSANEVATSNRIFQGADARTGSSSLNVIPTSTFDGEIWINMDLTGISNPRIQFYAFSKKNGATSTRPALLSFSTSIDGGTSFLDNVTIGDETTFPNNNSTSYTQYTYNLPSNAINQKNVTVLITIERGAGSGSAAELVLDDFTIEDEAIPLDISSVTAPTSTSVLITFNQEVTRATAEVIGNYSINNGITISEANRTATNQVTLTTSPMPSNNYMITINNVHDRTSGTPVSNLQDNFSLITPLAINSTHVVDKNTIELYFNLDLNELSAETTLNYSVDNDLGNPVTAVLDPDDNKKVILTFSSDLQANSYTTTVNNVQDVSTLAAASNLTGGFKYQPLAIASLSTLSSTQIQVIFNQTVSATSANTVSSYSVNFGFGNPSSAVQDESNGAIVVLSYGSALVNNTYTLTVNNVTNTDGNSTATNLQSNVVYNTITGIRQIVINELFVDPAGSLAPNPQVLPNTSTDEFIELYNSSSNAIDIGNFDMAGGTIGSFVLQPHAYVILTATSNVTDFQSFGDVIGVTSWNTLTNGGEQLILRDNLGNLVDSLTYGPTWYRDDSKSDGGWSLEQINPNLICSDTNNWSASVDVRGASPGGQNSVYNTKPDATGPDLIRVFHSSSNEVIVVFNEIMDQASLMGGNFELDNGLSVSNVSVNSPSLKSATLTLSSPMTSGTVYQLTVTGATDCTGNSIGTNVRTYLYDVEAPVLQRLVLRDTVILEMVFDEEIGQTSAEKESNYSINESIGNPSSAVKSNTAERTVLTFSNTLTLGTEYTLTHQNVMDTLGNASALTNTRFTFKNDIDTVIVISNQLLDVYFDQDVDETSAETVANYSVDRGIGNPNSAARDNSNAKLVHLVFDSPFAQNTTQIITFDDLRNTSDSFIQLFNTGFVYDTNNPDVDSVVVIDATHLRVYFDEKLDQTSAEAINNYVVNNSVGSPSLVTLQSDQTSVVLEFPIAFAQEIQNVLTLTAVQDLFGNAIPANRKFNFTYDRLAPRLVGIQVQSPTTISVEFSEEVVQAIAENTANYSIDNGIGNPISAVRSVENTNAVTLTFTSLGDNTLNTLTISSISDVFQNVLAANLAATFSSETVSFGTLSVLSDTSIQIQFTKFLDQASAENHLNYNFDNGIGLNSLTLNTNDPSIVHMNLNSKLVEGVNYRLVAQNLLDLDGNTSSTFSYDFQFDPQIASVSILSANSLLISFDKEVDETTSETVSNYYIDQNIGNPLTAVRNNTLNDQVTLFFNNALTEGTDHVLSIQNLTDNFGNIISASNTILNYDASAPFVTTINSIFTDEIEVIFNEIVDLATAQTLNHYSLNGIGNPISAKRSNDSPSKVILKFDRDLNDEQTYQLTVDRIEDAQGKAMSTSVEAFTFQAPVTPGFRDIVINEIYFDTDLGSTIPSIEYIELYNRGPVNVQLRGLSIADVRDTATFTDFTLNVGSYVTIASIAGQSSFTPFGDALGLSNFPSLSNSGETISLLDRSNTLIDSLAYNRDYYNDQAKEHGGYSIELINPNKVCFDVFNWVASNSTNGGTPGVQNSVYDVTPDSTSPQLQSLSAVNNQQLRITFSESMNVETLLPSNFEISNGLKISDLALQDEFGTEALINLSSTFDRGTTYTITLSGLTDCSGNALPTTNRDFFLGDTPRFHEVIITEIMADPNPVQGLPEVEFLELYNTSNRVLALGGITLADATGFATLPEFNLQPGARVILSPLNQTASFAIYGSVLGVPGWRNLTAESDNVSLTLNGNLIHEVFYTDQWYRSPEKANGGFSLEMIDLNYPCSEEANWTASTNASGGTPGALNSVNASNPDIIGPSLIEAVALGQNQIELRFDEKLNTSEIASGNFSISPATNISSLLIGNSKKTVTLTTDVLQQNTLYNINADNITDCTGNLIRSAGRDISLIVPIPADSLDIVVNEVLFNPASGGVRFIEIYNNSTNFINLNNWALAGHNNQRLIANTDLIIPPGDFKVITTDATILKDHYPRADQSTFIVTPLPNLNSTEGSISIINDQEKAIDHMIYSEDYHSQLLGDVNGVSLERIRPSSSSIDQNNWFSASSAENFATPGYVNSQFFTTREQHGSIIAEPPIFSPDQSGRPNFTTLNYEFDNPGNIINVTVYDAKGNAIKKVAENSLVGTKGFFRWDGSIDRGGKARVGYYMILLETISPDGKIYIHKARVAVGGRF